MQHYCFIVKHKFDCCAIDCPLVGSQRRPLIIFLYIHTHTNGQNQTLGKLESENVWFKFLENALKGCTIYFNVAIS